MGTSGNFGRDAGQWGALAAHGPADKRRQRGQVPGDGAGGLARIPWCERLPYGTIAAEVVTHRLLLLDWSRFPESIAAGATS